MNMPANVLSTQPIVSSYLPPRNVYRATAISGLSDVHYGGIAVDDPSHGITYQLWTCFSDRTDIWLTAPNTPAFKILPATNAVWVALAFDQNARAFIAYATAAGAASYYWFDSTVSSYVVSAIPGTVFRPFAALDDNRPALSASADILLNYVRQGVLYQRVQRDRYGVEYNLAPAPATLVQVGMSHANRFQFAFQSIRGDTALPPAEWDLGLGINEPA
jgi:hypothetical protein